VTVTLPPSLPAGLPPDPPTHHPADRSDDPGQLPGLLPGPWARATREAVTRRLVARAGRAFGRERVALERRAVLLNAPLAVEIVRDCAGPDGNHGRLLRIALSGLVSAVRSCETEPAADFTRFATAAIHRALAEHRSERPAATGRATSHGRPASHSRRPRSGRPLVVVRS